MLKVCSNRKLFRETSLERKKQIYIIWKTFWNKKTKKKMLKRECEIKYRKGKYFSLFSVYFGALSRFLIQPLNHCSTLCATWWVSFCSLIFFSYFFLLLLLLLLLLLFVMENSTTVMRNENRIKKERFLCGAIYEK